MHSYLEIAGGDNYIRALRVLSWKLAAVVVLCDPQPRQTPGEVAITALAPKVPQAKRPWGAFIDRIGWRGDL
jgi:hypothetical protein